VHAAGILRRFIAPHLQQVHARRRAAVFDVAAAVIAGGRLGSSAIGRAFPGRVAPKHNIKRVDRLLGNEGVHKDLVLFFAAIAAALLKEASPIVLVDWTRLNNGFGALSAAVPLGGRAVPIYIEVHPMKKWHNTALHTAFLRRLKESVVPTHCTPIVVADAGFQIAWFADVKAAGWHFIGNLNPTLMTAHQSVNPVWKYVSAFFNDATFKARSLGSRMVSKTNPLTAKLVLFKPKPKGRKSPVAHKRASVHAQAKKKAKTPCVLATSLESWSAAALLQVYRERMQIEETFRDAKSHRFGLSLVHTKSVSSMRWATLLLLASLAMLTAHVVGAAAEAADTHRRYQANTVKRRVLSKVTIGYLIMRCGDLSALGWAAIVDALDELRRSVGTRLPGAGGLAK
jgi:hypothetical protein